MNNALQRTDLGLIFQALSFAAEKHRHHCRKDADASPYINHPIALAQILIQEAEITDAIVLCAALIHDTIEDTGATLDDLETRFGVAIMEVVREVTDDMTLPKTVRTQRQTECAAEVGQPARLVKLAHLICTLRDISQSPPRNWSLERRLRYFDRLAQEAASLAGTHPTLEATFQSEYAHCSPPVNEPSSFSRENPDLYDEMDCRPNTPASL